MASPDTAATMKAMMAAYQKYTGRTYDFQDSTNNSVPGRPDITTSYSVAGSDGKLTVTNANGLIMFKETGGSLGEKGSVEMSYSPRTGSISLMNKDDGKVVDEIHMNKGTLTTNKGSGPDGKASPAAQEAVKKVWDFVQPPKKPALGLKGP